MLPASRSFARSILCLASFLVLLVSGAGLLAAPRSGDETAAALIARLKALAAREDVHGPAYRPIYHAAIPWFETWGYRGYDVADTWMTPPDQYAADLASALEAGRNFIAEHPGASFPLCFERTLADGKTVRANYLLSLPAGFGEPGRQFPLVVGLHGSGWLAHRISYSAGAKPAGRAFQVVPINEGGPWQLDFLNGYLDALLEMLPVDRDRVYVEGHSLGGMAAWEWAETNPERFAAISPRSGIGEPFRAVRLKHVPVWAIHGEKDDVILPGYAEQMVSALQECGASVRFSLLKGVGHNMPADLDDEQVLDWYLQQTRYRGPAPADPADALGLDASGASGWKLVRRPGGSFWRTDEIAASADWEMLRQTQAGLLRLAEASGEMVDRPICDEWDTSRQTLRFWLEVPRPLRQGAPLDAAAMRLEPRMGARFYFRGTTQAALQHLQAIAPEISAAGHIVSTRVWVTPLSLWRDTPGYLAEYWVELEPSPSSGPSVR